MEMIQIPFDKLGLGIDVDFLFIGDDVPSLLSIRDMYKKEMDT